MMNQRTAQCVFAVLLSTASVFTQTPVLINECTTESQLELVSEGTVNTGSRGNNSFFIEWHPIEEQLVVTDAESWTIDFIDPFNGAVSKKLDHNTNTVIFAVSPDGRYLGNLGSYFIEIVSIETNEIIYSFDLETVGEGSHYGLSTSLSWRPDSTSVIFTNDYRLFMLDIESLILRVADPYEAMERVPALAATWQPNGESIAVYNGHHTIAFVNPDTLKIQKRLEWEEGHYGGLEGAWAQSLEWSPNGAILSVVFRSSFEGYFVYLWNIETNSLVAVLPGCHNQVVSLAWSPDGSTLAVGYNTNSDLSSSQAISLWDTNSFELLLTTKMVSTYGITALQWNSNGRYLVGLDNIHWYIWSVD